MGMFDSRSNWTDTFAEGETFTLSAAKIQTIQTAEYGERDAALLLIDGKWYTLFGGAVVSQVGQQEEGDFPARVRVERVPSRRPGRAPMKVLVPEGMQPSDIIGNIPDSPSNDDDIPF